MKSLFAGLSTWSVIMTYFHMCCTYVHKLSLMLLEEQQLTKYLLYAACLNSSEVLEGILNWGVVFREGCRQMRLDSVLMEGWGSTSSHMPPVPKNRFQKCQKQGVLVWDMPQYSGGRGWRIAEPFRLAWATIQWVLHCLEKVCKVARWLSKWRLLCGQTWWPEFDLWNTEVEGERTGSPRLIQ